MKVKDLKAFIFPFVNIYILKCEFIDECIDGYVERYIKVYTDDIFYGCFKNVPENILNKTILSIGCRRRIGVVDICVEN